MVQMLQDVALFTMNRQMAGHYLRTTVITYRRSAIRWQRLLLVYITHPCYPNNGVQEEVKYFRKYST